MAGESSDFGASIAELQAVLLGTDSIDGFLREIFGPVLAVIPYGDDEEAVAIANYSRYGLSGAVWSGDEDRALAVARRLQTGSVDINGAPFNPLAPFGGYKQSGIGRELGHYGLDEFLQPKSIQQQIRK